MGRGLPCSSEYSADAKLRWLKFSGQLPATLPMSRRTSVCRLPKNWATSRDVVAGRPEWRETEGENASGMSWACDMVNLCVFSHWPLQNNKGPGAENCTQTARPIPPKGIVLAYSRPMMVIAYTTPKALDSLDRAQK